MTIAVDLDRLWRIAPRAHADYRRAFRVVDQTFPAFDIDTVVRAQHFFGQVLHETAGLTVMVENLNYSAARLREVWPSRFPTQESADLYAHNPEQLANRVYGGRLGNTAAGDGWRYIGRGLLQITGRENYAIVGRELGIPLEADPLKAIDPEYALAIAACMWKLRGANEAADEDDVQKVTRRINGGLVGIVDRRTWLGLARYVVREAENA